MQRRDFLQIAVMLGGITASGLVRALTQTAAAPLVAPRLLSDAQRAQISVLAELVIPRTDTPGAIDAGVPAFIEQIVTSWYTDTEHGIFMQGLDTLEHEAQQRFGNSYSACSEAQQTVLLAEQEVHARDQQRLHPPPQASAADKPLIDEQAPFFSKLKELVVVGYYTSERAALTEMVYLPVPNGYRGEATLADSDGKQYIW
ncbi:gluconate 2-dehydrogenase subunit 3 family protein [Pseudomonas sp. N040]|uniref:gluconate 2-dehydrogenase subunit 3 family protein n=1 Tax=Pseudomonas sp. N040 TaxID=2785325 RepID=UPI0018A2C6DA|nr:gluconate 2-dehydrogenase subunit 3 family protein [Pseudomonas sp. N040]MBF7729663.1 gluconate 2-dehydrogenase subunit 3 family protein [Pseudomonas sp. N040]MBW7013305.1 gluconate 2-dehydrogenase subunit 3 family protein [Pseudomonas sp. N040]